MKKVTYVFPIIKFFIAFFLTKTFYRELYNYDFWLVGEKKTEARDNGYHLFKYIRENYPDINVYYVITKNSPDLHKVASYGNIIYCSTMRHYMYFCSASKIINSQLPNRNNAIPFWGKLVKLFPFLRNKSQHFVYLKHGIYKDEMGHARDYQKTKFSIISCAAEKEREFIMRTYGYPNTSALLLGLCRFDSLYNLKDFKSKQILIMPTFRNWLVASDRTKEAKDKEKKKFEGSDYYKVYLNLLNSDYLTHLLKEFDYNLLFYPHYSMQSYIDLFKRNVKKDRIIIADRFNYDVQELLTSSQVMITDFSSVFFDFAYMRKPEVYFQFDEEKYRKKHYSKGYFSYKNDGFGPVVHNVKDLLEELEKVLINNGEMEEKYLNRVKNFFTICDDNNCYRTFNAIKRL